MTWCCTVDSGLPHLMLRALLFYKHRSGAGSDIVGFLITGRRRRGGDGVTEDTSNSHTQVFSL